MSYRKGASFERWLLHALAGRGFLVVRTAGSGHLKGPDLLAFKGPKAYALEAKFHEGERLSIPREQFETLRRWEEKALFRSFVVWKRSRKPPLFIPLPYFSERKASYSLSWEDALAYGLSLLEL